MGYYFHVSRALARSHPPFARIAFPLNSRHSHTHPSAAPNIAIAHNTLARCPCLGRHSSYNIMHLCIKKVMIELFEGGAPCVYRQRDMRAPPPAASVFSSSSVCIFDALNLKKPRRTTAHLSPLIRRFTRKSPACWSASSESIDINESDS